MLNLVPTSSTTAVMVIEMLCCRFDGAQGFEPEDFARFHPGSALGRRFLSKVDDFMIPSGEYPEVNHQMVLGDISAMSLARTTCQ